jgi:hypothetical protein
VFTHFWITGSPASGSGADNATVRYYIDGETTASIEFKPPLATGVGFDDLTLWGTAMAGHGAKSGAWNIQYRIPFQVRGASVAKTPPPPTTTTTTHAARRHPTS